MVAVRVTDLDRSLRFNAAIGYVELGRIASGDGRSLVVLKFPGEPVAALEHDEDGQIDRLVQSDPTVASTAAAPRRCRA
jgi:hypothetical protein